MQVFIAFHKMSNMDELEATLDAWDELKDATPVGLQCRPFRFELDRRVMAENLSKDDYILCDLNYGPVSRNTIATALSELRNKNEKVGLLRINPGIAMCRKGVVKRWPQKVSKDYMEEHSFAYSLEGYDTKISRLTGKKLILPC